MTINNAPDITPATIADYYAGMPPSGEAAAEALAAQFGAEGDDE